MEDNTVYARPSIRRAYFYSFLYAVAVLGGRMATNLDPRLNPFWWATFAILVLAIAWALLVKFTTRYIVTDDEIHCSSGILSRRIVIVPLNRVTNAIATQSLLERVLGLMTIQIDSAGGDSKEVRFLRILKEEALVLAKLIKERRAKLTKDGSPAT